MATQWLTKQEALALIGVSPKCLEGWCSKGHYFATVPVSGEYPKGKKKVACVCPLLGRPIRTKAIGGHNDGRLYSADDLDRIVRLGKREYAPFKDEAGREWLDRQSAITEFPWLAVRYWYWKSENHWPYGKITPREFPCRGSGRIGISSRRFWSRVELERVDENIRTVGTEDASGWLTWEQAQDLATQKGVSLHHKKFHEFVRSLPVDRVRREPREVNRPGSPSLRKKLVVSQSSLLDWITKQKNRPHWNRAKNHGEAAEFVRLLVKDGSVRVTEAEEKCKK
jgi:hypothetical protein